MDQCQRIDTKSQNIAAHVIHGPTTSLALELNGVEVDECALDF